MKLMVCDCCDHYSQTKRLKINMNAPMIDPNLLAMCEKCEQKFADRNKWGAWLKAVKELCETTQKYI